MLPKTGFVIATALAWVWPIAHVDGGLHRSIRDVCAGFPWPSDHMWVNLLSPQVTKAQSDGPLKADFDLFKVVRKMPPFDKCIKTLASGEVNTEEQTVAEAWIQDIISGQWWKTYETTVFWGNGGTPHHLILSSDLQKPFKFDMALPNECRYYRMELGFRVGFEQVETVGGNWLMALPPGCAKSLPCTDTRQNELIP